MRASAGVLLLGLGAAFSASAAEHSTAPEQGPDIELLEYLGGLVEDHDRWVGPEDMQGVGDEHEPRIVLHDDSADPENVK